MVDDAFEIAILLDAGPVKAGVAEAIAAFNGMFKIMVEARSKAEEMATSTMKMRDSLRDIVALSGKTGVSDKELVKNLDFMRATNLRAQEAHTFREMFGGQAETYRDKMGAGEYEKFETKAGKFAAMVGGDPTGVAALAGQVLAKGPKGMTSDQAMLQVAQNFQELNLGNWANTAMSQAVSKGTAALVGEQGEGRIGSLREAAIIGAATSRFGGVGEISTKMRQFTQGVLGQAGSKDWNEFVREGLHVKAGSNAEDAMEKVFGFMQKEKGKGKDLTDTLTEYGLKDIRIRETLINMFNQRKEMRAAFAGEGQGRLRTVEDLNKVMDVGMKSPDQLNRQADVALETAKIQEGMHYEELSRLRKLAAAKLLGQRKIGPEALSDQAMGEYATRRMAGGLTGEDLMIDEQVKRDREEATRIRLGAARGPGFFGRLANMTRSGDTPRQVTRHTVAGELLEGITGGQIGAKAFDASWFGRTFGAGTFELQKNITAANAAKAAGGQRALEQELLPGPAGLMTRAEMEVYGHEQRMSGPQITAMLTKAIADANAFNKKNMDKPMLPARPARAVRP